MSENILDHKSIWLFIDPNTKWNWTDNEGVNSTTGGGQWGPFDSRALAVAHCNKYHKNPTVGYLIFNDPA
jgi:hypothetical protein